MELHCRMIMPISDRTFDAIRPVIDPGRRHGVGVRPHAQAVHSRHMFR